MEYLRRLQLLRHLRPRQLLLGIFCSDLKRFDVIARREFKHGIGHNGFADGAQAAGAKFEFERFLRNVFNRVIRKFQLDAFQFKEFFVLERQGVFRLCKDAPQGGHIERV